MTDSSTGSILVLAVLFYGGVFVFGVMAWVNTYRTAERKGRSGVAWALLFVVFGILAWIAVHLISDRRATGMARSAITPRSVAYAPMLADTPLALRLDHAKGKHDDFQRFGCPRCPVTQGHDAVLAHQGKRGRAT